MSNPLIATVDEGNAAGGLLTNMKDAGNGYWAGTGIFYDAKSTIDDARKGDWLGLGIDVAADGLDALGLLMDPFGVLLSAPIGWIIEHVSFLKEPLDLVAGDPDQVRAKAGTWTNIAAALEKSASDYRTSAQALQQGGFTGAAATAYGKAAENYCGAVEGAAGHARDAAKAIEVAGAIVGTVRGTIRDLISQFCADALIKGLAALALSVETFGGSVAAWVADTVFEASSLAARLASKITKLVQEIKQLVSAARRSLTALDEAGRDLSAGARSAERSSGRAAEEGADDATRAASATPGHEEPPTVGKGGEEPSAPHTRAEERQEAAADYQAATTRQGQVEANLTAAERRVGQAQTSVSQAESRLAAARTPRERAAAERDIEQAREHVDRYTQQADHWRSEVADQKAKVDDALDRYRESYKNEDGPMPEDLHEQLDRLRELAMQGKESRADAGERGEGAEESTGELEDGSLVSTGE